MIVPDTRISLAVVPLERIVVTEIQPRYPDRVLHYVRLLTDPKHADDYAGFVHLAPYGDPESGLYTILDGHHRYLASVIAGRGSVLALIIVEPHQTTYDLPNAAWLTPLQVVDIAPPAMQSKRGKVGGAR